MRFAVKNLKDTPHMICRFSGHKVTIKPNDMTIIDTDDDREYSYWQN